MDKTIVIGLGGTGLHTLRGLRKLVVESYGSLDAEAVKSLGYLYLDTDPSEVSVKKDTRGKWEVLGKSTQLSYSEYKILQAPSIGSVVEDIDSYPHVKEWLPLEDLDSINKTAKDTPGASQIRPLGRFILTMSSGEIESAFKNIYTKIPQKQGGGKTQIYLVCSLSGGTGSGMFLDLAYLIKQWTAGDCAIYAFLVLPELTTNRGIRYTVNAYAALLELNYFSNCGEYDIAGQRKKIQFKIPGKTEGINSSPFDYCYLVGPRNNAGVELDLNAIPGMIAHRIFLNFDSSFGDAASGLLNNGKMERSQLLVDGFNGNRHSLNFFTFGLSSIQYPIDQFLEIFGYKLAHNLIGEWHRRKDYPGDINARTQGYLPLLKLTDEYILGDKDFFGTKHFNPYQVEVDNIINNLKQTKPDKNIAPYLTKQLEMRENEYRGVGIPAYYQNKRNDLHGALSEVSKLLVRKISDDLVNPELGYDFCEKILNEMIRIFSEKHKTLVDTFNGMPTKEKNSRESLNGFFSELTKNEDKFIFKDKALKDSINKIGEAMKRNLEAKIGLRAYEFGIAFISRLIDDLKAQKENLKNWRDAVERMKNEIESEIATRINSISKKIENVKEFNGSLLFSESKIGQLYGSLDLKSAMGYIEREALKSLDGGVLNLPFSNFNIESMYKLGLDWLQNFSVFRLSETNVADKLLEEYTDITIRRDIISQNYRKSIPFIVVDDAETNKGFGENKHYLVTSGTTNARLVGILNDQDGKIKAVSDVIGDIKRATDDNIKIERISDNHQVLFLQEYTAFPLRIIRDLKTLKEQYDQYIKSSDKPLPLHISKAFDPPLMDLFLTTATQIREVQKAEENFILARAVQKINLQINAMQGYPEIRYRFVEAGIEKFAVLGNSWEAAFDNIKANNPEMKKYRERLDKDLNSFLKGFETKIKRDELWYSLDSMIKDVRDGLDYKEEDPIYKKYNAVRGRIVTNLKLYDDNNLPDEKNRKKSVPSEKSFVEVQPVALSETHVSGPPSALPENEQKYLSLVRTVLRNSKERELSPVMENMLKSNQKKYGISDVKAASIVEEVRDELFGSQKLREYEELIRVFMEDGAINEDERAILIERQVELGLTDEQASSIEASVISNRR
jgi:site-specific DNA-cytosine methylase